MSDDGNPTVKYAAVFQCLLTGCALLLATPIGLGMAIWGVVIYSNNTVKTEAATDSDTCRAYTMHQLFLAVIILSFIQIGCNVMGSICGVIEQLISAFLLEGKPLPKCSQAMTSCNGLMGLASLACLIAMAVFNWQSSCITVAPVFYSMLHPWMITQFALGAAALVFTCFVFYAICCGAICLGACLVAAGFSDAQ